LAATEVIAAISAEASPLWAQAEPVALAVITLAAGSPAPTAADVVATSAGASVVGATPAVGSAVALAVATQVGAAASVVAGNMAATRQTTVATSART
jgi:hypothetical protein